MTGGGPQIASAIGNPATAVAFYVNEAPVISIPIARCLFFMMYPIMVKADFGEVLKAGWLIYSPKQVDTSQ